MEEKTAFVRLAEIQAKIKAPKGELNKFGGFKYRTVSAILEALKPHLDGDAIVLSDEVAQIGERYYVKATATLRHGDSEASATAYAREQSSKKGMDEAQITGSASAYARKYALCGLLAIDDSEDDPDGGPETPPDDERRAQAMKVANGKPDAVQAARAALNAAIEKWAGFAGADAKAAKANIAKRHDYQPTVEFYRKAAGEFDQLTADAMQAQACEISEAMQALATE